jgi:hypothetical protein
MGVWPLRLSEQSVTQELSCAQNEKKLDTSVPDVVALDAADFEVLMRPNLCVAAFELILLWSGQQLSNIRLLRCFLANLLMLDA